MGKVAPTYKSENKDDLNNYRPISVLSTLARVFEKILYGQLYDHFTSNKLLRSQQFGFRTLHSTALAMSKCTSNWWLNTDRGDMNLVVFLDIRKAFDTVNYQILLDKLHCYGIGDGELLFFRSYLQNRTQCCSANRQKSTLQTVTYRVPQGSIFGSLLFIIYMNDPPAFIQEANITMYADDTNLHKAFQTSHELKREMIPAFSKICKWLRNNKLSLNTVKTEFMIIATLPRLNQLDSSPESTSYAIVVDKQEMKELSL